jgi:hypothetical protein
MRIPRLHRRLAPCAGVLLVLLLAAAPARADDVGHKIIRLCAEGKSLAGFPPSAYAKALKEISPTTEEYSECGQLIRQAQGAAASGKHSSGGGSSAAASAAVQATPAEQKSIAAAARAGSAGVDLGGGEVHPGVVHANVASALSTLPTPVLALLAFLLACLAAFGVSVARKRMRGERAD